jgi:protein SCO1
MARKTWAVIAAIVIVLLVFIAIISVHPAFAAPAGSRYGANYFPNVELTTQDRKTVHFYDDLLKGKIVVIDLIYTHCKDMCPLETAKLAQVQKMLGDRVGKDIFFYSISIDPKADTPEVMKAYAEKFHAGPGWLFLTAKKEDIDLISNKLGLTSVTDKETRDGHKPSLMIGNEPAGMWMRNTATDNPKFLALTITNLLTGWSGRKTELAKGNAQSAPLVPAKGQHSFAGQYLFGARCAACHSIGHGDRIGPDLQGVTDIRDRAWLVRFIARPDQVLAAKDPIATALFKKYKQVTMPNVRLSDEDATAIVDFLKDQAASSEAKAHTETVGKAAAGNEAAGVNTQR